MVRFSFTFLLGIRSHLTEENNEEKSTKSVGKLEVEKNHVEIQVSKADFSCHIEYVLYPNEAPKSIDVICWKDAAKIYFENTTSAIKPLLMKKLRWIHFRVNHDKKTSTEDVPILHAHNVRITVSLGNKKLGDPAKFDNVKKFYCPKSSEGEREEINQKPHFQPLSETLKDFKSDCFIEEHPTAHRRPNISLDTAIETSEYSDRVYRSMVEMSNEYNDQNCSRTPSPPLELSSPVNKTKPSQARESPIGKKGTGSEFLEISISGEEFFSGKKILQNFLKYHSEELPYILNFIAVRNVLGSRYQAELFNPFSVSLHHCKYLPTAKLEKLGITKVKFQYVICNEFLAESTSLSINSLEKINFSRTILTDKLNKKELIYFLQTEGLKINVLGDWAPEQQIRKKKKSIYDSDTMRSDKNVLRLQKAPNFLKQSDTILLGTAFVDMSSVLLQPHETLLKCNLKIPSVYFALFENGSDGHFMGPDNIDPCKLPNKNFKSSEFLVESSTILTVSAKVGYSLANVYRNVVMSRNIFNRLFAVVHDPDIIVSILGIIQNDVEKHSLRDNGLHADGPLTKKRTAMSDFSSDSKLKHITGFIIECERKIFIFVEGSIQSNLQKIWARVASIKSSQGRVLYDSSLVFTSRLYENFFKYGGSFKISTSVLDKPGVNSECLVAGHACRAITCLYKLTRCKSIKTAIQNNLFPDPDSLMSMALQFGTPPLSVSESPPHSLSHAA